MQKMDICTCKITLGGDNRQVVFRGPTRPMTYPEVDLMRYMHGDRFVTDVVVIKTVETTNSAELEALRTKYGKTAREAFPGTRPRLPLEAPADVPRDYIIDEPVSEAAGPAEPVPEEGHSSPAKRPRPAKVD